MDMINWWIAKEIFVSKETSKGIARVEFEGVGAISRIDD